MATDARRVALSSTLPIPLPRTLSETEEPYKALSDEINVATRSTHTHLNRLITARLPLALPPHSADPGLYLAGLAHFAPVYHTFETLWQARLSEDTSDSFHAEYRVATILQHLHLPALCRSDALSEDIAHLAALHSTSKRPRPRATPVLSAFTAHIHAAITERPHVLLAYAWVLYMALFAGGRHLRAQLLRPGPDFWTSSTKPQPSAEVPPPGLALFHFPGPVDGEDLKASFRARFAAAAAHLTPEERGDVVVEAGEIFRRCIALVEELDAVVADDAGARAVSAVDPRRAMMERARAPAGLLAALLLALALYFVPVRPRLLAFFT
ncbi:MAG: heme oxygenase [Thelocarpon impressellum]|nr:MAG: heme oxygenase [Thelocarpon impressellum]